MPDSITAPVPDSFHVSVIVAFRMTPENRWQDGYWQVTGAVAGDQPGKDNVGGRQLHAASQVQQYLWTGLQVKLFRDDAENYYYNLVSDNPRVFIICSQETGEPPQPLIATLSYGEASSYMETDMLVESVVMPPELYRWAEHFVLEHFVPEKRKKRKRDNWKETDHEPRG
ncbi:MAG TPA: DUF3305 domain-containing protein [Gammaproteobacteria bacterium]|nr:DUF3305 domain-containing protein [Gammaproteobacteria bacterium]